MHALARHETREVVVIGASFGGVESLPKVLGPLPAAFPASIVIVQHRSPTAAPDILVDILSRRTALPVSVAEQGGRHEPGHAYVAPPDVHVTFSDGHFNLSAGARENHARPSINRLFRSAAAHYGSRCVGVIMTGLLDDGVAGLVAIAQVGGVTLVQDPATAIAADLPRNALAAVPTSQRVALDSLGEAVIEATAVPAPILPVADELLYEASLDTRLADPAELDKLGRRVAVSCDECGGPLWEMPGEGPVRYRCFLGHAMSAVDRLIKHDEEIEVAMWNAVRALTERGTTLASLATDARSRDDETSAVGFERRARETFAQARLAYELMQKLAANRR